MKIEDLERFVARAQAAQAAVDALGAGPPKDGMDKRDKDQWQGVGERAKDWASYYSGVAAGMTPKDGMDKIVQKTKPKEYKSKPRRKGRAKLAYQLMKLTMDVARFVTKANISQADREWAGNLLFQLQQLRHYQSQEGR